MGNPSYTNEGMLAYFNSNLVVLAEIRPPPQVTKPIASELENDHAGKPQGSQALYNKVMWYLYHRDDSQPDPSADIVAIAEPCSEEEEAALRLRSLMRLQAGSREMQAKQVASHSRFQRQRLLF